MKLKRITACILAAAMTMSVALTGCGGSTIDANAVGATLNGEEISLGFMNFVARYNQAITDATYISYFGTELWSMEMSEGVTMEDSTKESVADNVLIMHLLEDHMADHGVEITEEELGAIDEAAKKFMADNSQKAIKQMGATEEYVKEFLLLYTIQTKVRDAVYESTEITVTEEDAAQRTFSYIEVAATSTTDSEGNKVDYTDEEKEELEASMTAYATEAKADFDKAAEAHSYEVSTYSYGADESSMDEAVIAAADALKEGEVSELIVTEENYYVIRLDSEFDKEATASKLESMIEQEKADNYTHVCEHYKEEATWELNESAWGTVKFDRLFGIATENTEE